MTETPISRLAFARQEIDRVFGDGYAREHPDVVVAVMLSGRQRLRAFTLARAISEIAAVLVEDAPEQIERPIGIVRAHGLVQP